MGAIDTAIDAARRVAATPEAAELRRHSGNTAGVWTEEDERRLRAGWIQVWNPNARRWERLNVPVAGVAR